MKTLLAAISAGALLSAGVARADAEERDYLVESTSFDEGSSTLAVQMAPVLGKESSVVSGILLWNLGKHLSAGVGLSTLASSVSPDVPGAGKLSLFYGGLELEAPLYSYSFLSLAAAAELGAGQVAYRVADAATGKKRLAQASLRVFEPSLAAYFHVTRVADIGLAFGVRRASRPGLAGLDDKGLDAQVASILLRGNF